MTRGLDDLALARKLVAMASDIALSLVGRARSDRKADGSFVSEADLAVERCLMEFLERERPDDDVLSEEFGSRIVSRSNRRWILDPVDGTAKFLSGDAQWGTHVALEERGRIVLGVISRPRLGMYWWAKRGAGAHRGSIGGGDATRLCVSSTRNLGESRVTLWSNGSDPRIERLKRHVAWIEPDWDAILRLAEGKVDGVVDTGGKAWDHAPSVVIVEEAGGRFGDSKGGARIDLGEGRFTNGHIHQQLDELLASIHQGAQGAAP